MINSMRIREITLEGPDLSGKTTLYSEIHKATKFKWNIQDRAEISMAIYADMYGRADAGLWRERIYEKLKDLNHRYVILVPTEDLLLERLAIRGDEVQDENSLIDVARKFREAASELSKYPTCIVIDVTKENQFSVTQRTLGHLRRIESSDTKDLCLEVMRCAAGSPNREMTALKFNLDLTNFTDYDRNVLEYEKEKEYYSRISRTLLSTISKEIEGENEYNLPQDPATTRRFVFADSSCISYINVHIRDEVMTTRVVFRSSDVDVTFSYDIKFLQILEKDIRNILGKTCFIKRSILDVRLDSAHIPGGFN